MLLKQITDQLDIWTGWRDRYKSNVPKFIQEAKTKQDWKDWDEDIFWEYFERSKGQCVSSLGQGYFTKAEQQRLKYNWLTFAPLLRQIAESQDAPQFELYQSLEKELLKYLDTNKKAAIHRLIAGLQPNLLTTIVKHSFLNDLYHVLKASGIEINGYDYGNWYKGSYKTLQLFKKTLPHLSFYELVTYPWQTLEHLQNQDINLTIMDENTQAIIDLLLYKKQIILQGPPGTGKTKLAKEIAYYLTAKEDRTAENMDLKDEQIAEALRGVTVVYSIATEKPYDVVNLDLNGKKVFLQKQNGTIDESSFESIKQHYKNKSWQERIDNNDIRRATAIAKFIYDKIGQNKNGSDSINPQCKIIQFHPSYSYEDFVRGIIAKPNPEGTGIIYEAQNKLIASFAKEALENWKAATSPVSLSLEKWLEDTIDDFLEYLTEKIADNPKSVKLTDKAFVERVTENSIRYNGDAWGIDGGVPISDLVKMYKADVGSRSDVKELITLTKTAKHLSTYWLKVLDLFKDFLSSKRLVPPTEAPSQNLRNFVLIIDEINRANLSSVLGELIYALEYRGEIVESMYEVKDSDQLVLPQNLLIIGTMNTADRSVGHIDYAIRRRFAFVDVLPEILTDVPFEIELFKKVSEFFVENMDPDKPSEYLSSEFRPKDVWIGHSYFIKNLDLDSKIRLKYEIIPILEEYIKDGVLKDTDKLKNAIKGLGNIIE